MPLPQIETSAVGEATQLPALIVILGPTGVGKTTIAISLARRLGGEIVSADSLLFYRGMDIGTAKPSLQEQQGVPHHLIDVAQPDQTWSLAQFQLHARLAISGIHARNRLPFLVGGAGQYIRAVVEGWQAPVIAANPALRKALEGWATEIGKDGLFQRLAVLDPKAAAGMDPHNLRRTIRALEVILSSGRLFSEQRQRSPSPYRLLQIGLTMPRQVLYDRLDARLEAMIQSGFVDEIQRLFEQGYSVGLPTMSAIGYRELTAYLQGQLTLPEALQEIRRRTRVFVRRQANWFKLDDPQIHWFDLTRSSEDDIYVVIEKFISGLQMNDEPITEERNLPAEKI